MRSTNLTRSFSVPKYFIPFLVLTLISVIFCFFVPIPVQNMVSMLGILSFGILHGANDLKIIAKKTSHQKKNNSLQFFVLYIVVVFLGIILFYFIPRFALLSFVLVSCYHFGEQHWSDRYEGKASPFVFFILYGALIFMMLFSHQYAESSKIIFQITSVQLPFQFFWIGTIVSFIGIIVYSILNKIPLNVVLLELLLLGLLALLFSKATLIFGFGFYFVLWHSLPSLQSQIYYIYDKETKRPLLQYIKSALLYWVMAIIGLLFFYYFVDLPQEYMLSIFFSFLAAITFPHAIVMTLMFYSEEANGD